MIEHMTKASQETTNRRWALIFVAALAAVLGTQLSSSTASAATAGVAETRVRASSAAVEVPVGPSEHISAGQRLGEAADRVVTTVATGVAANSGGSTFYTVQSADDAARLASGGTPWPTSATRAEFGPGVYAWGNLDNAASYAAQLEKRGACIQICEFSLDTSQLRHVDVDSLADPSDFMSKYSQLWGGTPSHGADYITRGTQFGTQHYFSPNAFGSASWGGPR